MRPLCTSLKTNNSLIEDMLLDAAFLVDGMREFEFDDQINSISEKYADRLKLKYVGPAPPFNFVELVIHWGAVE